MFERIISDLDDFSPYWQIVVVLIIPALFCARILWACRSQKSRGDGFAHPILMLLWLAISVICVCLVMVPLLFPGVSQKSPIIVQLAHLKEVGKYLGYYADDHGGKFPEALADALPADAPDYIRRFHYPDSNEMHDWFYYPGHTKSDSSNSAIIIAASPVCWHGYKRLALFDNGMVLYMPEKEFLSELRKQIKRQ